MIVKGVKNSFNHSLVEPRLSEAWIKKKIFKSKPLSNKKKFSIVMPPPNVTGTLHIGHALNMTLQDILARYWRMNGRDVLWQPGTDHAGIATQSLVEKNVLKTKKIRKDQMGKEKFISEIWKWKDDSGKKILNQIRCLGALPDWDRVKFTLDKDMSKSVTFAFKDLYNKGFIYKDKRLINWDIKLQTAISDLEVEQREQNGIFVYIKYRIENSKNYIVIATTRPETLFGDCCIAVNPKDNRYRKFIGKKVIIPLTDNCIPIIEDKYVDTEKGTGALKVTPAHDFNDNKIGKKYKLSNKIIFDKKGKFNLNVPKQYQGLDRLLTREVIIKDLKSKGHIEKIEKIIHTVPYGDRSGTIIEPYLTEQWFLNVKELAKKAISSVKNQDTIFYPKSWTKTFYSWMNEIEPWCISRQIWWGHQIPVWYGPDNKIFVGVDEREAAEEAQKIYGKKVSLKQESDVLDTWFSSSLWPMSTLGWPEKSNYFKEYFPTDLLITGFDIIFFWVARMIMQSVHFTKSTPFKAVYIHALIRDKEGQKMSKSRGNIIDPLILIEKFGADPLRLTLSSMAAQGRDIKLSEEMVKISRNFITKIWNSFVFLDKHSCLKEKQIDLSNISLDSNIWIIGELNAFIDNLNDCIKKYRFNDAAKEIYKFIKNTFCDWYLELAKITFQNNIDSTLLEEVRVVSGFVFRTILKLCHPFIPFLTDHLYFDKLKSNKYLQEEKWPEKISCKKSKLAISNINYIIAFVTRVRKIRSNLNLETKFTAKIYVENKRLKAMKNRNIIDNINFLAKVDLISFEKNKKKKDKVFKFVLSGDTFLIENPVNSSIANKPKSDISMIKAELAKIDAEIIRLNAKLKNKNFLDRAPTKIVEETKIKLKKNLELKEKILIVK